MSYNVRDDAALFGPGAAVEILAGAGAPVKGNIQFYEPAGLFGIAAAGATGNYCIFLTPPNPSGAIVPLQGATTNVGAAAYQILGGSFVYDTASTSGTFALENCNAGTATGSGSNILSTATVSTSTASTSTPASLTLTTTFDNLLLQPNSRINVKFGGTATNLVNFSLVLYVARIA